jgi:hypothetical protein
MVKDSLAPWFTVTSDGLIEPLEPAEAVMV